MREAGAMETIMMRSFEMLPEARRAGATIAAVALLAACGAPRTDPAAEQADAAPAAVADAQTTVETPSGVSPYSQALHDAPPYRELHDIQWFMANIMQPVTDVFWGSAGWVIDAEGERSLAPTTEEGWANVVTNAAIMGELGNVLMTPPYAEGRGDDWIEFAGALADISVQAQAAAESRSEDDIFEVGSTVYRICQACHMVYIDPDIYDAPPDPDVP
jgi:cytochrome c5